MLMLKHVARCSLLALGFGLPGVAAAADRLMCNVVPEFDYPPEMTPRLQKTCADAGTPFETCTDFSVSAQGDPKLAWTFAQSGIGRGTQGEALFRPTRVYDIQVNQNGATAVWWVVSLIDNSGSPSRAEERFIVLDGRFKPVTAVLSAADFQAQLARWTVVIQEGAYMEECRAAS